jgi:RNA polymerase sigma-70 factor (ECF subfamily)
MNPDTRFGHYTHKMSTSSSLSDLDLMRQIAVKDEHALEELYRRYHLTIFNFFLRTTQERASGEDLLQDFFINVWQGAARFEGRSSVKTWLFRIAHFMAAGWLRDKKKHLQEHTQESLEMLTGEANLSVENLAFSKWNYAQIQKAVASLSPPQREIIEYTFTHSMTHTEIAYILDCPVGTVKSRLHMALRQLNRILSAKGILK